MGVAQLNDSYEPLALDKGVRAIRVSDTIILMHDGGGDRAQSVAALETVLRDLSQQGYVFRNVHVP